MMDHDQPGLSSGSSTSKKKEKRKKKGRDKFSSPTTRDYLSSKISFSYI